MNRQTNPRDHECRPHDHGLGYVASRAASASRWLPVRPRSSARADATTASMSILAVRASTTMGADRAPRRSCATMPSSSWGSTSRTRSRVCSRRKPNAGDRRCPGAAEATTTAEVGGGEAQERCDESLEPLDRGCARSQRRWPAQDAILELSHRGVDNLDRASGVARRRTFPSTSPWAGSRFSSRSSASARMHCDAEGARPRARRLRRWRQKARSYVPSRRESQPPSPPRISPTSGARGSSVVKLTTMPSASPSTAPTAIAAPMLMRASLRRGRPAAAATGSGWICRSRELLGVHRSMSGRLGSRLPKRWPERRASRRPRR
jgi:hypothetical protein